MDIKLDALIEAHIQSEGLRKKRRIGHYWASDAGKCKRQVYYTFTNPKVFAPSKLRTFKIGTILHEYVQGVLKSLSGTKFSEVWNEKYVMVTDVETDFVITGRIDTFLTSMDESDPSVILEFKSENERSFSYRKQVPYAHKCQLTLYMRSQRIPYGYVVYINKSTMEFNAIKVEYSEALFKSIMRNIRDIHWHLQNSKLPPKSFKEAWECRYCPWSDDCKKTENPALHDRLFPKKENGGSDDNKT